MDEMSEWRADGYGSNNMGFIVLYSFAVAVYTQTC